MDPYCKLISLTLLRATWKYEDSIGITTFTVHTNTDDKVQGRPDQVTALELESLGTGVQSVLFCLASVNQFGGDPAGVFLLCDKEYESIDLTPTPALFFLVTQEQPTLIPQHASFSAVAFIKEVLHQDFPYA